MTTRSASPPRSISMCSIMSTAIPARTSIRRGFAHKALYNDAESRVETDLQAVSDQRVDICGDERVFRAGELIHTESS